MEKIFLIENGAFFSEYGHTYQLLLETGSFSTSILTVESLQYSREQRSTLNSYT